MSDRTRIARKRAIEKPLSDTLQRSAAAPEQSVDEVPPVVQEVLSTSGQPLDAAVQAFMEPRFGHDFSKVRVHTDERAVESAQAVNARAYTVGQDVVFGAGQYAPETDEGKRLLAHELTHTIQQVDHQQFAGRMRTSRPADVTEREAENVAHAVMDSQPFAVPSRATGEIARQDDGGTTDAGTVHDASLPGGVPADPNAPPSAAPPANFRVVRTEHGTFNVYPDDFVGPLPLSDYTTQGWPVRQAVFDRIEVVINAISGGAGKITIGGDNAFKTSVLSDLAWLLSVSVGMDLLTAIIASGKTLTINPSSGGNRTSYAPDADSFELADHTPGPGADVTISYNTAEWNPYGGTDDWMRRPPAVGLAHELVHGWTGMIGTRALGETAGVRRRELQATGLGEFSAAAISENQFRQAFGLPLRPHY